MENHPSSEFHLPFQEAVDKARRIFSVDFDRRYVAAYLGVSSLDGTWRFVIIDRSSQSTQFSLMQPSSSITPDVVLRSSNDANAGAVRCENFIARVQERREEAEVDGEQSVNVEAPSMSTARVDAIASFFAHRPERRYYAQPLGAATHAGFHRFVILDRYGEGDALARTIELQNGTFGANPTEVARWLNTNAFSEQVIADLLLSESDTHRMQ